MKAFASNFSQAIEVHRTTEINNYCILIWKKQMSTNKEDNFKSLARIKRFTGGVLILYVYVLLGVWFLDGYLIIKHLSPLPNLLMIVTLMAFILLFWFNRRLKRSIGLR